MNKFFLEILQKKIDNLNNQLELFNEEDDIIEIVTTETHYSSLKWARDLYLDCCEKENEKITDD